MTKTSAGERPCRYRVVGGVLVVLGALLIGLSWSAQPLFAKDDRAAEDLKWGVKMAKRGLWSEAMFRFQEAASLEPNNAQILNNLAVSLEAVGRFEEALEVYQRALKVDAGSRDLRANYARFVEFYQAFKGPEAQTETTPDELPDANADPPPAEGLSDAASGDEGSGN